MLFTFTPTHDVKNVSLGSIYVHWSRAEAAGSDPNPTPVAPPTAAVQLLSPMPAVSVCVGTFGLSWELPTEGRLGEVLTLRLRVANNTKQMRALRLSYSENDAFLFCGLKVHHFRLPPLFSQTLCWNLVPIRTGAVPLPTPSIFEVTTNCELIDPPPRHHVFVLPCAPSLPVRTPQLAQSV